MSSGQDAFAVSLDGFEAYICFQRDSAGNRTGLFDMQQVNGNPFTLEQLIALVPFVRNYVSKY